MKMGLGAVALMAVCCAGPLLLSVLASGALLGAPAVWAGARPWFLAGGAVLAVSAVWLLRRRLIGDRAQCSVPPRTVV